MNVFRAGVAILISLLFSGKPAHGCIAKSICHSAQHGAAQLGVQRTDAGADVGLSMVGASYPWQPLGWLLGLDLRAGKLEGRTYQAELGTGFSLVHNNQHHLMVMQGVGVARHGLSSGAAVSLPTTLHASLRAGDFRVAASASIRWHPRAAIRREYLTQFSVRIGQTHRQSVQFVSVGGYGTLAFGRGFYLGFYHRHLGGKDSLGLVLGFGLDIQVSAPMPESELPAGYRMM